MFFLFWTNDIHGELLCTVHGAEWWKTQGTFYRIVLTTSPWSLQKTKVRERKNRTFQKDQEKYIPVLKELHCTYTRQMFLWYKYNVMKARLGSFIHSWGLYLNGYNGVNIWHHCQVKLHSHSCRFLSANVNPKNLFKTRIMLLCLHNPLTFVKVVIHEFTC